MRRFIIVFISLSLTAAAAAQSTGAQRAGRAAESVASMPPATPPVAQAAPVVEPPILDGEVLTDPAWTSAPIITGFWQTRPFEGQPATEKTEVRIVYTKEALFVGVVCYDSEPEGIIVSDSRRDSSLEETDSFQLILDTYLDRQNGFVFGTNPAAIEYDAQVSREGQGTSRFANAGRMQQGAGGGFNINWDGSWEVRTKTSSIGWCAEFQIPFRTLRYPEGRDQTWGMNFQRNIRRRNEVAFWAPLKRQFNLYRLSEAGTLTSLSIAGQRNFKLMPYVLGEIRREPYEGRNTNYLGSVGGDVKFGITPSLTLDGTFNTDFAQVEVDEQQINLDRFNLFFPEKRPFFLENAGLFTVGSPGETELFFSRRIGLGPKGEVVPILAGARMSGKISKMNVGFLNMQTSEVEGVTQANNFTVARVGRELPNRSFIGGIFTNRQGTGRLSTGKDYNRAFGFDGRWGIGEYGLVSGFVAGTQTPGSSSGQHAFKVNATRDSPKWELMAEYAEVGDNFNPEVGFLSREDGYRFMQSRIMRRYRPTEFMGLHELRPHVSYRGYWNFEGFQETGFLHVDNHSEWRNGYELHTAINFTQEGVTKPFEIFPGVTIPTGTYRHKEAMIVFITNQAAPLSLNSRLTAGGFFGGDRISWDPTMKLRSGETFSTEISWSYNDINLPGGDFTTNLLRTRVTYSFSPRVSIQGLVQYNDRADRWSVNLRFAWLQAANTGLFVVYKETRDIGDLTLGIPDRSFIMKYSHLFDIFN
jgi:hypothetical protein